MKPVLSIFGFLALAVCLSSCTQATDFDIKSTIAVASICCIWLLFLGLAFYSNLLRDEITNCAEFDSKVAQQSATRKWAVDKTAPFSLTKVQFGIWTAIISSVYLYLSLFKGDCAATGPNKTALVLMGIFAGTAVASSLMDKSEVNDNRPRHQNSPSQGFFLDILSDQNGISLHRFQNFAWTLIAIVVYLYKVAEIKSGCDLPELSDTLLSLTGISSVTYLVLKSKENTPADTTDTKIPAPEAVG